MKTVRLVLMLTASALVLSFCVEQHKPYEHWKQIHKERMKANKPSLKLTEDNVLPWDAAANQGEEVVDGKALYGQFCASCHGKTGKADGAAAMALKPSDRLSLMMR